MIKVGTCVPSMKIGDVKYNVQQIEAMMEEHKDCAVLVFPELSICGYTCQDLFFQQDLLKACKRGLFVVVEKSNYYQDMVVIVGMPLEVQGKLYNVAAVIQNGEVLGFVPKTYIPNYNEFYEGRYFTPYVNGESIIVEEEDFAILSNRCVFTCCDSKVSFGVEICEDLWVATAPSNAYAMQGVDFVVNLSASNEYFTKKKDRRDLVLHQSKVGRMAYIYCSSGEDESTSDLVFSGHCMVAQGGQMLNEMIYPKGNTCMKTILDLDAMKSIRLKETHKVQRDKMPSIAGSSLNLYGNGMKVEEVALQLKKDGYTINPLPFLPTSDKQESMFEILEIQARGLLTRLHKTGMKNMVLGVSGGLDSTLALIVCSLVTKFDPTTYITAVTMPSKGNTSSTTYQNAIALIQGFGARLKEVEIGEEVVKHLHTIGHPGTYQGTNDTTYENAQARMRTYLLMDIANYTQGLVIGTGDLSELALGWCTYNGDHMSMYSVNASIPKTLVKFLCKEYAKTVEDKALQDAILSVVETPISPELTPSKDGKIAQKTEDTVGKYDLNDFYLYEFVHYGYEVEKIVLDTLVAFDGITIEEVKKSLGNFYRRFFTQQFKRNCVPDGVKATCMSVSPRGDWRMASDASYQLYLDVLNRL